jgi:simple sugar transport system ATP-binding protein
MDVLRLQNLQKSFGSVRALKNASLTLREGEVVALLGDNGAGKSTLIKAISGVFPADRGDIYVRGEKVSIRSTRDAMDLGIETIHQDTSLAPDLSIARNLFLGREPVKFGWLGVFAPLDLAKLRKAASELLKRVGISKKLDADALVSTLSGGERQSIAISRAMQFAAKVIILDEPTNNLGVAETQGVLSFVRNARDSGHSCIFIAHNIHHVFQVVDRIVVMRRGKVVADDIDPKKTNVAEVERIITGMSDKEIRDAIAEGRPSHG